MLIDCHIHESRHSFDSQMDLYQAIATAKSAGLDGLCITNHDNNRLRHEIGDSCYIDGMLIIVGAEILTYEGDILVFGLDDIPEEMMCAQDLLTLVKQQKGASIAAHPFRNNNRGIGKNMRRLAPLLTAVEAFNGSTMHAHNLQAFYLANKLGLPVMGNSDAHVLKQVGYFATDFKGRIRDHIDFIEAMHSREYTPIMRNGEEREAGYVSCQVEPSAPLVFG
ncbi:MAG: PHP domain-containing protein [Tissierellia bacterium]|nr:PHP domain-containing protein [Tissierellia bacterium]